MRRVVPFPDGDLFRPLLADPKEPRSGFAYRHVHLLDGAMAAGGLTQNFNAGGISAGGLVGMWARLVSPCHGVQISLLGSVFSEFNLDAPSRDLINTDFVVGAQFSFRTNGISARVRVYHQSSHLGDDFVRHSPSTADLNFGFQAIDGVVSIDRERWRLYGGGGYLVFMNGDGSSGMLHAGAEFRARRLRRIFRPVAAVDLTSVETRSWGLTTAASAGLEWTSPSATRRMRALVQFSTGFTPFGQFAVEQKSRTLGLQLQIEF